jgi:hypothetical protein
VRVVALSGCVPDTNRKPPCVLSESGLRAPVGRCRGGGSWAILADVRVSTQSIQRMVGYFSLICPLLFSSEVLLMETYDVTSQEKVLLAMRLYYETNRLMWYEEVLAA